MSRATASVFTAAVLLMCAVSAVNCNAANSSTNLPLAQSQLPAAVEVTAPVPKWNKLPLATLGAKCGEGIAVCMHGCCSQNGFCGMAANECGPLCQAAFSSPSAVCQGKARIVAPDQATLPVVGAGKVCGGYVAVCDKGLCCTDMNYCEPEIDPNTNKPSFACSLSSCVLTGSPNSKVCKDARQRVKPVVRRYVLNATWGRASPDGYDVRVILINGAYPGPTLFANVGDRVVVEFHNNLARPTTVHWHGVKQVNTDIMDGVGDITQAPIEGSEDAPASSSKNSSTASIFIYNFVASVAGSLWYHDHFDPLSLTDGLRGTLVISDRWSPEVSPVFKKEPLVVFVADHYHDKARELNALYVNASNSGGVEPVPVSQWINGFAGVETPWCGGGNKGPPCKSAVINSAEAIESCDAKSGPNVLLVLVGASAFASFDVHIESKAQLRARVVSVDASLLAKPVPVNLTAEDPLELAPGQRYGVELCAVGDPKLAREKPARIIARTPLDQFGQRDATSNGLGLDGSPTCSPSTMTNCSIVDVASAVLNLNGRKKGQYANEVIEGSKLPPWPADPPAASSTDNEDLSAPPGLRMLKLDGPTTAPPPNATKMVPLVISTGLLSTSSPSPQYFFFNNITFSVPFNDSSLLYQKYENGGVLPANAAPGTAGYNVLSFALGDIIDLVVTNEDPGVHPLHLHGQNFWVMAAGPPDTKFDPDAPGALQPHYVRDVAVVQPGSYIVMRFTASNPGLWLYHCHIEFHLAAGLGLVVSVS